jgi:hypothetical protein
MDIKVDNASLDKLIEGQIKVAAAEVLSKHSPELIRRLVDHALARKRDNAYSSERSIFEETVQKMIIDEATAACKEWLDEQRPLIRKLVYEAIKRKDNGLAQKIAEQLVTGLSKSLNVSTYLQSKE